MHSQGIKRPDITAATGLSRTAIGQLILKAKERGWQPGTTPKDEHVIDAPKSGRPAKLAGDRAARLEWLLEENPTTAAFTTLQLSEELAKSYTTTTSAGDVITHQGIKVSQTTVRRYLKAAKYRYVKYTTKPGLNEDQRWTRLQWAWKHRNWTLQDWAQVVWSDETSVVLGHVRGKRRIWRRSHYAYKKQYIRQRWKGRMEFMFWGSFTYDHIGPCYVWPKETADMKAQYEAIMKSHNDPLVEAARADWELTKPMERLNIKRNKPGPKPTFKFTEAQGAMVRNKDSKGIDWMRYQQEILVPRFIPFLKDLASREPHRQWLAQQDNAPCHKKSWNMKLWEHEGIKTLEWPPNSPDLSAIEPPWRYMKFSSCRASRLLGHKKAAALWVRQWKIFNQNKLRRYVERIGSNLQWVLFRLGGNDYKEGSLPPVLTDDEKTALYVKIERILARKPKAQQPDERVIPGSNGLTVGQLRYLLRGQKK
jgi:transposase